MVMGTDAAVESGLEAENHPLFRSIQPLLKHNLPITAHINGDTSWLVLLPYPQHDSDDVAQPRFFKLLIDPWFTGFNEQGAIFSRLLYAEQHNEPSSVQTISELELVLHEIARHERASADNLCHSPIDLVVVSNDNGDHCNEATLRQLHPSVPVVALPLPMKIIQSYRHFEPQSLHLMSSFASCIPEGAASKRSFFRVRAGGPSPLDWRLATYPGLPKWLGLAWTSTPREYPAFHTPLIIAFPKPGKAQNGSGQAIMYTPHSAPPSALTLFHAAQPHLSFLAILAGLHRVWVKGLIQISEGARGGIEFLKELHPEYWLATHDEVKEASAKGLLIPPLLRRQPYGIADVVRLAGKCGFTGRIVGSGEERGPKDVKVLQLGSGEACVLGEVREQITRVNP